MDSPLRRHHGPYRRVQERRVLVEEEVEEEVKEPPGQVLHGEEPLDVVSQLVLEWDGSGVVRYGRPPLADEVIRLVNTMSDVSPSPRTYY